MLLSRRGPHDEGASIAAIAAALVFGAAVWADPAGAAVFEFTLGSESEVDLLSFQLGPDPEFFAATAPLDSSTATWVQDVSTGQVFPKAEVTETFADFGRTLDFSDVSAASVFEDTFGDVPTITATFRYRAVSVLAPAVPELPVWAMHLLGLAGLGYSRRNARRRRPQRAFGA